MLKVFLYIIAVMAETGIGIYIFQTVFTERNIMTKKQMLSEAGMLAILFITTYSFSKAYGIIHDDVGFRKTLRTVSVVIVSIYIGYRTLDKCHKASSAVKLFMQLGMVFIISGQYWAAYLSTNIILLGNIIPVLYLYCYYQCTIGQAFLWEFFYLTNLGIMKALYIGIYGSINHKWFQDFYSFPRNHTYSEIIFLLVVCAVIFLIFRYIRSESIIKKMLTTYKKRLFWITMGEWCLLSMVTQLGQGEIVEKNFVMIVLLAFGITMGLLVMYTKDFIISVKNEKIFLYEQNKIMGNQYNELKESNERYRCLIHDEKHMIAFLQECMVKGEYKNAVKFLGDYSENIQRQGDLKWTGFPTIDFMINTKKRKMDTLKAKFYLDADVNEIPMEDTDLIVMLGNLFDNAIEAIEKCDVDNRRISLSIKSINEIFMLKMQNTSIQEPYIQNNRFITDKKEKERHGLGIQSVNYIIEKYNGILDFQYTGNNFEVSVFINN